jgi:hypothetical protein
MSFTKEALTKGSLQARPSFNGASRTLGAAHRHIRARMPEMDDSARSEFRLAQTNQDLGDIDRTELGTTFSKGANTGREALAREMLGE